ncbi:MAG: hypothetical protein PVJ86_14220 [Phycisphaerales bacterium]
MVINRPAGSEKTKPIQTQFQKRTRLDAILDAHGAMGEASELAN